MPYRPSLSKRLLANPHVRFALTSVVSLLLRGIFLLSRVTRRIDPRAEPYVRGEKPAMFCFWHGRMILMPFFKPPKRRTFAMASHHRDGAIIAEMLRRFGIATIRG